MSEQPWDKSAKQIGDMIVSGDDADARFAEVIKSACEAYAAQQTAALSVECERLHNENVSQKHQLRSVRLGKETLKAERDTLAAQLKQAREALAECVATLRKPDHQLACEKAQIILEVTATAPEAGKDKQ